MSTRCLSNVWTLCFFWCFKYAITIQFVAIVYKAHQLRLHVVCVYPRVADIICHHSVQDSSVKITCGIRISISG